MSADEWRLSGSTTWVRNDWHWAAELQLDYFCEWPRLAHSPERGAVQPLPARAGYRISCPGACQESKAVRPLIS